MGKLPLTIAILIVISCTRPDVRVIYYYESCNSDEANADLIRSVQKAETILKKVSIEVKKGTDGKGCGYKLVLNDKEKVVSGAMTDIDLIAMAEAFYDVRILK